MKRYDQRIKQYHQSRQFRNNESVFYSRLNSEDLHVTSEIPGKKEAKEFWSNLWSKNGTHNENAKWLKDFKTSTNFYVVLWKNFNKFLEQKKTIIFDRFCFIKKN